MKTIRVFAVAVLLFACAWAVNAAAMKLVPSEFVVKPGSIRWWRFDVESTALIIGRFRAQGGVGHDIEAIVAEWDECENWINRNDANVLYTSGKVTNGKVRVSIGERGSYCIAFSNRTAVVSAKEIVADIALYKSGAIQ